MKGYRTAIYNLLSMMLGVIGILLITDLSALGISGTTAAWIVLGLKVADNIINLILRLYTDTAIGEKGQ